MVTTTSSTSASTVALTYEQLKTPKGNLKARAALEAGKRVTIHVTGAEAFTVGTAITRTGPNGTANLTGVEEVALAAVIVTGLVTALGLGVVAVVCLYGMHLGYRVTARHKAHSKGNVLDDEITFILIPPTPTD